MNIIGTWRLERAEGQNWPHRRAAEETPFDQNLLRVDRATYARFVELLDWPPQPNDGLQKLLRQKAPWEG